MTDGKAMETKYPDAKQEDSHQDGLEYQDFITDILLKELGISIANYQSKKWQYNKGENPQGIEIKFDSWCSKSSRLSVEIAEKTRTDQMDWIPSGIYRNDNTWIYIQGNYEIVFIYQKSILKMLHSSKKFNWKEKEENTVRTFYVPFDLAKKYAAKVIYIRAKGNLDNV